MGPFAKAACGDNACGGSGAGGRHVVDRPEKKSSSKAKDPETTECLENHTAAEITVAKGVCAKNRGSSDS